MAAGLAVSLVACGSSGIQVRTASSPNRNLAGLYTFRVLDAPQRREDAPALPADDPMLTNSITNQALRNELTQAIKRKGYAVHLDSPEFVIAYYAGTKEKMDTTYWNPDPSWRYGFRGRRAYSAWPWYSPSPFASFQVQTYTQGCVVVDVVDPRTNELLWRGQGVAAVSSDPDKYVQALQESVSAILKKFPNASVVSSNTSRVSYR